MANAEVLIIIKATDKASAAIKGINTAFGKLKGNLTDSLKQIPGLGGAISALTNPLTLATVGIGAISKTIQKSINDTMDYSLAMGDLAKVWGTSVEEASKLVQVADDVRISQASMSAAMRYAMRNGIEPTVEGLKGAAETYQSFKNTQERASWATKTFGRNWTEVARLLEQTPEQFDASIASAEKFGLVIGQDNVRAAKDYYAALDDLNDSAEGLKIQLGTKLIPVATEVVKTFNEGTTAGFAIGEELKTIADLVLERLYPNLMKLTNEVYNVTSNMSAGMGDLRAYEQGLYDVDTAAGETADSLNNVEYGIQGVTKAAMGKEILFYLNEEFKKTGDLDAYAKGAEYVMTSLLDMTAQEAITSVALTDLKQDFIDGQTEANAAAAEVWRYIAALDAANGKSVETTITTYHRDVYEAPTGGGGYVDPGTGSGYGGERQHGGPVKKGNLYKVGEGGWEYFMPNQNGTIIPNSASRMMNNTHNWNLTINEAGRTVNPSGAFAMMRALAG